MASNAAITALAQVASMTLGATRVSANSMAPQLPASSVPAMSTVVVGSGESGLGALLPPCCSSTGAVPRQPVSASVTRTTSLFMFGAS